MPDQPILISNKEEALSKKKEFCNLVEDVIRGDHPLQSHVVAETVLTPTQLANTRQATRVMALRARKLVDSTQVKRR